MAARSRRVSGLRFVRGGSSSGEGGEREPDARDPIRMFLAPGETWAAFCARGAANAAASVPIDFGSRTTPQRDGVRLSFLRTHVECGKCGGVVGSGRRQVREMRGGVVTWTCRICAQGDERAEVRALAALVRRVRKGPCAER